MNLERFEFSVTADVVAELEAMLCNAGEGHQPDTLAALAWQLRQRDTCRALALVVESRAHRPGFESGDAPAQRRDARLTLVEAEAAWLQGDLAAAQALAEQALACYTAHNDATGVGDAQWIMATVLRDRGDIGGSNTALAQAGAAYQQSGDRTRISAASFRAIFLLAFTDTEAATAALKACGATVTGPHHPAAATWLELALAIKPSQQGDAMASIPPYVRAYEAGLASGQLRSAIIAAINIGVGYGNLHVFEEALAWQGRALDHARAAGWKPTMGICLAQVAKVMGDLGRHEAALPLLTEALAMVPPGSHLHVVTLLYLSNASLSLGRHADALEWVEQANAIARRHGIEEDAVGRVPAHAEALMHLNRFDEALALTERALAQARLQNGHHTMVLLLRLLARIHRHAASASGAPPDSTRRPLQCLEQALAQSESTANLKVHPDLLEALAEEHALLGEMAQAYALSKRAVSARGAIQNAQAQNRAVAVQIRHETEKLRAEAEHHRQLSQAQAQRADLMLQTNATLEQLGAIGRDITASLDAAAVFAALDSHVHALLDAFALAVFRVEPDGQTLTLAFGVEDRKPIAPHSCALDDPERHVSRCARKRCEIVIDADPETKGTSPGTVATHSLLFAPLLVADRLLGVMTIQSPRPHAYTERERAIFRSLCAYGAIALANAEAQAELLRKNEELERLATTDKLTGLYNRRYLESVLEREVAAAQRHGQALSVLILDVDHFKRVNDSHGHLAGDRVLTAIGLLLAQRVRISDVAARWGGEEFMVVLPGTLREDARVVAESLRLRIAEHVHPGIGQCTVSMGLASWRAGDSVARLAGRADSALYAAKLAGRNQLQIEGITNPALP